MRDPLKRPWWDRFTAWKSRPVCVDSIEPFAHFVAGYFIKHYAQEAEKNGWQPAHLMGPRGLAYAWAAVGYPDFPWAPSHVRFEPKIMVYPCGEHVVARRAMSDGSCALITGGDLTILRGRYLELEALCG